MKAIYKGTVYEVIAKCSNPPGLMIVDYISGWTLGEGSIIKDDIIIVDNIEDYYGKKAIIFDVDDFIVIHEKKFKKLKLKI